MVVGGSVGVVVVGLIDIMVVTGSPVVRLSGFVFTERLEIAMVVMLSLSRPNTKDRYGESP